MGDANGDLCPDPPFCFDIKELKVRCCGSDVLTFPSELVDDSTATGGDDDDDDDVVLVLVSVSPFVTVDVDDVVVVVFAQADEYSGVTP